MSVEQEQKERQMQIDSRRLELSPPPGPCQLQIVFECEEADYKIGHIITQNDNGGWRDSYMRIPQCPKVEKKLKLLIITKLKKQPKFII